MAQPIPQEEGLYLCQDTKPQRESSFEGRKKARNKGISRGHRKIYKHWYSISCSFREHIHCHLSLLHVSVCVQEIRDAWNRLPSSLNQRPCNQNICCPVIKVFFLHIKEWKKFWITMHVLIFQCTKRKKIFIYANYDMLPWITVTWGTWHIFLNKHLWQAHFKAI